MKTGRVKLVYFSPTGTTKAVLQGIGRGIGPAETEIIDITRPAARKEPLRASEDDLLVIGVPVYMGRVPAIITGWLRSLRGRNTPTVCVVVYGNRVYEDALLELADIVTECGCVPVAGGAFIGEHSFSDAGTPTAQGRPDANDLRCAEEFGKRIREKLDSFPSDIRIPAITLPGTHPYRGDPKLWTVDFIAVSDACIECGLCAKNCPTGAIAPGNSRSIDTAICISCCACIKNCPHHARTMKPGLVKDAQLRLHTLYRERREPEYFL